MGASLRVHLVAALLGLVLALAGLGAWSAWHLWEMGEVAQRILADNYRSVEAAQQMREALERIDADRRVALAGSAPALAAESRRAPDAIRRRAGGGSGKPDRARRGGDRRADPHRRRPLSRRRSGRPRPGDAARRHRPSARSQPRGDGWQEPRRRRRGPAQRRVGRRARPGPHSGRHRRDDGDRQPRRPADRGPDARLGADCRRQSRRRGPPIATTSWGRWPGRSTPWPFACARCAFRTRKP